MRNESHARSAYLSLGSNLGDREANLKEAVERIKVLGLEITGESSIYDTEPVGYKEQPWFLNEVIEAKIPSHLIQAEPLLSELLDIESEMGRERSIPNGPRVIDIDLLLLGDLVIGFSRDDDEPETVNRPDVTVPHPRMHLRRFVLEPLCEIAPDVQHPTLKKTCQQILSELDDPSRVRLYRKRGR